MLKVTNLRKEYDIVVAVDGVSLEVRRGELFGLLGPNGAGKTTIIRTILNIIQPDSGEITFNGKSFVKEMWNDIGYLPEERGLYRKSKIVNTILYFASLKGISVKEAKPLVYYWLERFGLKSLPTQFLAPTVFAGHCAADCMNQRGSEARCVIFGMVGQEVSFICS